MLGALEAVLLRVEAPTPIAQPLAVRAQQSHKLRICDALLGLVAGLLQSDVPESPIHQDFRTPGVRGFLRHLMQVRPHTGTFCLAAAPAVERFLTTRGRGQSPVDWSPGSGGAAPAERES